MTFRPENSPKIYGKFRTRWSRPILMARLSVPTRHLRPTWTETTENWNRRVQTSALTLLFPCEKKSITKAYKLTTAPRPPPRWVYIVVDALPSSPPTLGWRCRSSKLRRTGQKYSRVERSWPCATKLCQRKIYFFRTIFPRWGGRSRPGEKVRYLTWYLIVDESYLRKKWRL